MMKAIVVIPVCFECMFCALNLPTLAYGRLKLEGIVVILGSGSDISDMRRESRIFPSFFFLNPFGIHVLSACLHLSPKAASLTGTNARGLNEV